MESIPDKHTPVLVIDDDEGLLLSIKATLVSSGLPEPALLSDSRNALALVRKHSFQLILLDLMMPHLNGMEVLKKIKDEFPDPECVIVSASDEVGTAVQAMSLGASDYLVKPLNSEKLIALVNRILEKHTLRYELEQFGRKKLFSELKNPEAFADLVAEDEAMALVFHQVEAVAGTDYSVVINGESGTGKEMLARVIHRLSNRSTAPFYAVNMASFSKTIFEDEFFGHTKGAYTDAGSDRRGFFEVAHGGTLFLDEITELDPSLQAKLLRVLEDREFYPLGSRKTTKVDVRIISATNQNLEQLVKEKRFRQDLYYRLNVMRLELPPLKERKGDVPLLISHILKRLCATRNSRVEKFSNDAMEVLLNYDYPGNVRELENIIEHALIVCQDKIIERKHLPLALQGGVARPLPAARDEKVPIEKEIESTEKAVILDMLRKYHWNKGQTASALSINRTTLWRKMKKYNISF